ncbi:hypothetical protein L2095_02470 [Bacillus zanthoxyli]|nr:hypothetical protein [Bacillus zanthoxyli]
MQKKICFISLGNLYLSPYIKKYISLIDCEYDVIYWNRHDIDEDVGASKTFAFNFKMDEGKSKIEKLVGYLKFRTYATKILQNNNYDGVIVLQTSMGILLKKTLIKYYQYKYVVDIRDYTMERNKLFYRIERNLINKSALTVISSKGFKKFLPPYDYVVVHNDNDISQEDMEKFLSRKTVRKKIAISYIGLIRFHEQNKKIILKFKNDERFTIRFIGKDAFALKEFCEENQIQNVELIDQFPPDKTMYYYNETDIICNLYGNNTPLLDFALSNKLYYAAKLNMPILVCPDTYMEEISTKYGFGISFDLDSDNACDELDNYYKSINWEDLQEGCSSFLQDVRNDNEHYKNAISQFLKSL